MCGGRDIEKDIGREGHREKGWDRKGIEGDPRSVGDSRHPLKILELIKLIMSK